MKKLITFAVCLMFAASTQAQKRTAYCDVLDFSAGTLFGKKVISVDFGNNAANELLDEGGKGIKFNSIVDALNYMARNGWRLIATEHVVTNAVIAKTDVVHYFLTKDIESEADIYAGLNIKVKRDEPYKRKGGDDMY